MIRRDVQLADGAAGWFLISQIEHARISAQLAEHCVGRFRAPELSEVRREVLAAILHHDDGWAEWERLPRLDDKRRRPVSFMELQTHEALEIWTRSIDRAEAIGPLAPWMVAGHFSRLIQKHSDSADADNGAAEWYEDMQRRREQWLARWQAGQPSVHTAELAEEALQWLWTFDEISLWFCCRCPAAGQQRPVAAESSKVGRETPLEMTLTASPTACGLALAAPWRFDANSINLEAAAVLVPATNYKTSDELLAAGRPNALRWRLAINESSD